MPMPPDHELGPNFATLGIIEHPVAIARHRLRFSRLPPTSPLDVYNPQITQRLWTDGSIVWGDVFWLTAGGCAVVDHDGNCIFSTAVQHWNLCSYTVEFYAIAAAFLCADTVVEIYADCQSVVKHFAYLIEHQQIQDDWPWFPWWKKVLDVFIQRKQIVEQPVQVHWIPSHTFDGIPVELITDDMLLAKRTTLQHVKCNQKADLIAKEVAAADTAVAPKDKAWLLQAIAGRQDWLVALNKRFAVDVATSKPKATQLEQPPQVIDFRTAFPRWRWDDNPATCHLQKDFSGLAKPAWWKGLMHPGNRYFNLLHL